MASANPFAVLMSPSASATPSTHSPLGKWKRTLCYVGCLILLLSLSSQSYHFLLFFVPLLWFQFTFNLISWRNLPPSSKKTRYDVFINHRGPDTKQTLAASIYRALKLMGLRVFLDEPELDLGDSIPSEIQHAIATSFLHIAILSPTYAESTWCLEELSLMLKTGQTIIPLFYNVDINHIRWIRKGDGPYAEAISKLEAKEISKLEAKKRYSPEKIEDWKSTLEKVSYLKGYIVNSKNDEEVLKIIKNYVLKQSKKTPFVMPKHLVGLDKILQDFERSVLQSSKNVKIVGITGMGGCGKTTLAEQYYNKMIQSSYRCSFLFDVSTEKLYEMQKKMFQDLDLGGCSEDVSFDSVEEGKAILTKYLSFVQVFIILDNVDHLNQLESLLPMKDLGHGSVIVVISRDSHILRAWGIPSDSIYKMEELNSEHSMELFCWRAFGKPSPKHGFECLVSSFLKFCHGLPLALKVLGGLVHGKSKDFWVSQLEKVSKSLPKDITSLLKVSFDALDEEEKEIFLDISCFFIGREKDSAIAVWDESEWSGECSLQTLVDKFLVEIDEYNCLRMHDLLRDLGRDISKTSSPYRLWSPQQVTSIFEKQREGSVLIRGIKAYTDEFYKAFVELVIKSGIRFQQNEGFKILDVKNNYFTEELASVSEGFVSVRWANFPHADLPSWFKLEKLRDLELSGASKLVELWSESAVPPVQLRVLRINYAGSFLRFPRSIGFLKHLKKIYFNGKGAPIEGLPDEFCCLQSLEELVFIDCNKLKALPSKFGNLKNLQTLILDKCSGIEGLPEEFDRLQSLEELTLICHNLKSLPSKFGDLANLKDLRISFCSERMIPPEAFVPLSSLNDLSMRLSNMPEIVIQSGCFSSPLSSLKKLVIGACTGVSRILISLHCCPTLQYLWLNKNHDLVEIDSLPISIKEVDVIACAGLESISLRGLAKLQRLNVVNCFNLRKIEGLENCSSLEVLILHTLHQVSVIENINMMDMESLRWVNIVSASQQLSAYGACLQTINREKWPSGLMITVESVAGVEAIVKSISSPALTLVDSFHRQQKQFGWQSLYVFLTERPANAAAMICLVIDCDGADFLKVTSVIDRRTFLLYGKWVCIGVFTASSLVGSQVSFSLGLCAKVEMGILVMGEESEVVDAFYQLVQDLVKAQDICESEDISEDI